MSSVLPYHQAPPDAGLVTADRHTAQVHISLAGSDQDDFIDHFDELAPLLQADGLRSELAGPYAVYADLTEISEADLAAVLVAMLAALSVLPAVLRLLGHRIDRGRLPVRGPATAARGAGRWTRVAHAVMRRPATVLGVIVVLLLAAGSPLLDARWGSVDHRVLPADAPARVASERLMSSGPETSTANVMVGADRAAIVGYADDMRDVDGVVDVETIEADDGAALLRAVWEGGSQTGASQEVVRVLWAVEPATGEEFVGGAAADTVDLIDSIGDRVPWMVLIIVVVIMVLLFLAFGSLVLPVKAIQPDPHARGPRRAVDGLRGVPVVSGA